MMLKRRGTAGFIKNRLIRIAGPLAVFWGPVMGVSTGVGPPDSISAVVPAPMASPR